VFAKEKTNHETQSQKEHQPTGWREKRGSVSLNVSVIGSGGREKRGFSQKSQKQQVIVAERAKGRDCPEWKNLNQVTQEFWRSGPIKIFKRGGGKRVLEGGRLPLQAEEEERN